MINPESFMLEELQNHNITYKYDGRNILVHCPFHEGSFWKLKYTIHKSGQYGHCWVCGKGGGWNPYAKKMGLKELDYNQIDQSETELLDVLNSIKFLENDPVIELPNGLEDWEGDWKRFGNGEDFHEDFLKTIPSYKWYDDDIGKYRILWPVTMNNVLKGWIAAKTDQETRLKYRNDKNLKSSKVLFLYDHNIHFIGGQYKKTLVLTEGPASAMRLIKEDIPAVAILGTTNWNEGKINYLLNRNYERIILAFDGDEAGHKCSDKAYGDLKDLFSDIRVIDFPDDIDPCTCSKKYINMLKKWIKS